VIPQDGKDWAVAVVIATEVPPPGSSALTPDEIQLAIGAVCNVIRARAQDPRFPNDPVLVVLEPKQFSGVGQDYWQRAMAGHWFPDHVWACLTQWRGAPAPAAEGALWYYSPISMNPPYSAPGWVAGKTEVVVEGLPQGFFRFYR